MPVQKKTHSQSSIPFHKEPSQLQMSPSFSQRPHQFVTPTKRTTQKIFVETPQPQFIPLSVKNYEPLVEYQKSYDSPELIKRPSKINIFNENSDSTVKQQPQVSQISLFAKQRALQSEQSSSSVVKSKVEISLKKERVTQFFYYQNFIVCKGMRKVLVYNSIDKGLTHIPIFHDEFILTEFPPYVFNCIIGQFLNLYSQETIDKYGQAQRRKDMTMKKNKTYQQLGGNNSEERLGGYEQKMTLEEESEVHKNEFKIITIKISKLEVECICKYGQAYYIGGYNRSVLPGGKRSERREVYLMENLDPKINNKPKSTIKIDPTNYPVSEIHIQMPYLVVYCRPTFYVFGLKSHELLLTFQKQLKVSLLLQGRYAFNVLNGIGISSRNLKPTIFTYDVENSPIYGVQITQHKQEATCLCMEKTGRIFGCLKSALFEYLPSKRITKCVKLYSDSETIVWIETTASNNLLVLRQTDKMEYFVEAFSIEEGTVGDYWQRKLEKKKYISWKVKIKTGFNGF